MMDLINTQKMEHTKLATTIFVMSIRPSLRVEQLLSHWRDFHEISYVSI